MNDTLFQITYKTSPKIFRETYRYYYLLRPTRLILHALLLGFSIVNLVYYFRYHSALSAVVGLLGLLLLTLTYLSYRRMASISRKRQEELSTGDNTVTYAVSEDGIRMCLAGNEPRTVSLDGFRRGYRTQHLLLLLSKARLLYIFPMDSFVQGSPEGLIRFLSSRGVRFT